MPRAHARNKTATPLTPAMPFTPGVDVPTAATSITGRGRGAHRTGNARQGQASTLQFLSLPRDRANDVIGTVNAANLAKYVNVICSTEFAQPGFIAQNPQWAYNLGAQMLGTD